MASLPRATPKRKEESLLRYNQFKTKTPADAILIFEIKFDNLF